MVLLCFASLVQGDPLQAEAFALWLPGMLGRFPN